jgi:hypothetical protein
MAQNPNQLSVLFLRPLYTINLTNPAAVIKRVIGRKETVLLFPSIVIQTSLQGS